MKKLVNAGLKSGEEFAIRLMRGEVFYCHVIGDYNRMYGFFDRQFVSRSSGIIMGISQEYFSPLDLTKDALASMMIEQDLTLADLIKIKQRLCSVADHQLDKHRFIALQTIFE